MISIFLLGIKQILESGNSGFSHRIGLEQFGLLLCMSRRLTLYKTAQMVLMADRFCAKSDTNPVMSPDLQNRLICFGNADSKTFSDNRCDVQGRMTGISRHPPASVNLFQQTIFTFSLLKGDVAPLKHIADGLPHGITVR